MTRREWTVNAWLTVLVALGVVVAANRLAKEHLRLRVDFSEERLHVPSSVAERLLGSLEDVLSVKAFFTGRLEHGPVQIAKSRLLDQLREFEDLGRGRMELVFADPNRSTDARVEARGYGIEPVPLRAIQGTSELTQEVYLGLVIRYRGREGVLPFVLPQTLQYGFLTELSRLIWDEEVAIGFLSGAGDGAPDVFGEARELLGRRYRVRELSDLANGEAVPADARVLVVVRPSELHPRAAFAIDQYVQTGGRVLLCVERVHIDLQGLEARLVDTGLGGLFDAWGVSVEKDLIWDQESNWLTIESVGRTQYPFWVNVGDAGMEPSVPVTGRLPGADLFWAHAVETTAVAGIEVTSLVRSSPKSWLVDPDDALTVDAGALNTHAIELFATEEGRRRDLAVALSGRFPSPFVDGAPAPRDAIAESIWRQKVRRALEEGREPPPRAVETTDEEVLSSAAYSQVVIIGDADWVADGKFSTRRNGLLFQNLVDWLALEDDLLALRAEIPKNRRIVDFLAEEKERRGLSALRGTGGLVLAGADSK
ncbi:MAG: GldG family protein, partial [Planctomycetota bacterium]|nr:GldG family protein [Planctomycetota bacterium]